MVSVMAVPTSGGYVWMDGILNPSKETGISNQAVGLSGIDIMGFPFFCLPKHRDTRQISIRTNIRDTERESARFTWGELTARDLQSSNKKIEEISRLGDNWNGYGAIAFSDDLIDKAKKVVAMLQRQPEIFPTAAESIQFEYDGPKESYLEIVVSKEERASVFMIDQDGYEHYDKINLDTNSLNRIVESFYG